jgi:tetratricopeptide (TPR) repeat protein
MVTMAQMLIAQDRHDDAEALLLRARVTEERAYAKGRGFALATQELGELYLEQGRYDKAEPLLLKALDVQEEFGEQLQTRMAELAQWRLRYALNRLYEEQERYDEARKYEDENLQEIRSFIEKTPPGVFDDNTEDADDGLFQDS